MTSKADFTEEEWTHLKRAPLVAGLAISLADPGGPIEAVKESMAALKTLLGAAEEGGRGELVEAIAKDVAAEAKQHKNPLSGFKPRGAMAGAQVLDDLREANRIVTEKASGENADAFRDWLLDAAREAAGAAKEGGFLGFHAQRVSEGEQQMLDKLRGVLSAG